MWGRIDGTPKITVAKEVMSGLVADLPADSKTGLLAYGHRRKGDCADIESLVGLGPLDRETMIDRIQGLNPKGKTPITAAVKQAVDELRQIEASASVVLVSDGLESCGGDPCEAVRAARESGVDFRLHVVGFDLGDADPAQLQCMAEAGGGEYYTAANAEELTGALEAAVAVKPGLVLEVTSNGERTPAWVYVHESGDDTVLMREKLGDSPKGHYRNPLRIPLDPGTYDIRVAPTELDTDPEKTLTGLEIPDEGEMERSIDFSDGQLKLDVTANGEWERARIDIYRAGTEERVVYENTYRKPEPFRLPPGDYDVRVTPKRLEAPAQWVRGVSVGAGEEVAESVDFSSGSLKLDITANEERERARIDIYHAGTEERVVYKNTYRKPKPFRLPPGDYDVRVTPKRLEAPVQWVRGVNLSAGEVVTKKVDFSVGAIKLDVTANGERERARVDIYQAGTEERVVYENTYRKPKPFRLPPGDYDVRVTPKRLEAPAQWVRGINLSAGEVVTKKVDFAVGAIKLDVTANGERERARIDIYHAGTEERVVYENTYRKPKPFRLPLGEYDVRVTPKNLEAPAQWVRGVNLSAGEVVTKKVDFSEPPSPGTEAN
jgi:Ca-activated chloride channel family protein